MNEINMFPKKSFFIKTLVKDIQLSDAILDLIDNSIDSYIENTIHGKRRIDINISKSKFEIIDNCGGIHKKDAEEKVFQFGTTKKIKGKTIGVFGVGLKRAIFKIGEKIHISSDDKKDCFSILIDEKWINNDKKWNLNFHEILTSQGKPFTKIVIEKVYKHISKELTQTFFNELYTRIKESYSEEIRSNIDIYLNKELVDVLQFKLLNNKLFTPAHIIKKRKNVKIEIYAGFTESSKKTDYFGWQIYCNGRMVLKNNTTKKTGWFKRKYHYPEDNRFLGIVFFSSDDALDLPWHTTKEDIQEDSETYIYAQSEMKNLTFKLTSFIRLMGKLKDPLTKETIGKSVFKEIPSKNISTVIKESEYGFPIPDGKIINDFSKISFDMRKELIEKTKNHMSLSYISNIELGIKLAKYYLNMENIDYDKDDL